MIELGRLADPPTDLLAPEAADGASLTAVQASLILLRLGAEAAGYGTGRTGSQSVARWVPAAVIVARFAPVLDELARGDDSRRELGSGRHRLRQGAGRDSSESMPAAEGLGKILGLANGALAFAEPSPPF